MRLERLRVSSDEELACKGGKSCSIRVAPVTTAETVDVAGWVQSFQLGFCFKFPGCEAGSTNRIGNDANRAW